MKTFLLTLVGILCSCLSFSQSLFVEHSDPKLVLELETWAMRNGYTISRDRANTDYIVSCKEINRNFVKGDFVFISVLNKTGNLLAQTKTKHTRNIRKAFVILAETELGTEMKKAIAKAAPETFRANFSDTLLAVVRSKTEVVTTRSTVSFTGKKDDEILYYFEFENTPVKAKFKGYHGSIYRGKLPDSNMIEVNILPDTTIKETMTYKVQLFYKLKDDSYFKKDKLFTIKVLAQEAVTPAPFHKNELIVFAGTTYDHFNPGNKISGLSFEPIFTTMVNKRLWIRFGAFLHPNFSRDTSVQTKVLYYKLGDYKSGQLPDSVGRYSTQIETGKKIQSIGFYTDFVFTINPKNKFEKGIRVSPTAHVEFVKRIMTPVSSFTRTISDTIRYRPSTVRISDLEDSLPNNSLLTNEKTTSNQFIGTLSPLFEVSLNNVYILFQPMFGGRFNYTRSATMESEIGTKLTSGYKFSIRFKELISFSIDHRDFLQKEEYLNISFGVPITVASLLKK